MSNCFTFKPLTSPVFLTCVLAVINSIPCSTFAEQALPAPAVATIADTPLEFHRSNTSIVPLNLSQLPHVADVDILAISDELKGLLDRTIANLSSGREKAIELHRLLFKPMFLNIDYVYNATHTAQQTYETREGNCLAHAALYTAAARYVGLKAQFQTVDVPRDWLDRDNFYIVPGHVNVVVKLPGNTITVEFADAYSAQHTQLLDSKVIPDKQVLAEYYNNIGMNYMEEKDYPTAIAYMQKSIDTYSKVGSVWSNIGVVYKLNGYLELAENAYKKGLKYDKRNMSIINNIYILYNQTGQYEKAQKLAKKVTRYSKKNPYYLEKLATTDLNLGNYGHAISLLKKAIALKQNEPEFYINMSFAYHQLGQYNESLKAATLAREYSTSEEEHNRFQSKLDILKRYQAGI
ncbi:tetratricopeptide repeat protein [Teredinibacter purpureus]|uniref:tetratricopeptide repeat protein n=1 Tax=Teredinibacter purpureus TaxID=2731756 RepID=UPI000696C2E7|nr:tetratricopeptide repeat protein [Teredinibacter purpureus]